MRANGTTRRSVGAIDLWRREMAAGTGGRFDDLWRAACYEARAIDARRDGMHAAAAADMQRAAELLASARPAVSGVADIPGPARRRDPFAHVRAAAAQRL